MKLRTKLAFGFGYSSIFVGILQVQGQVPVDYIYKEIGQVCSDQGKVFIGNQKIVYADNVVTTEVEINNCPNVSKDRNSKVVTLQIKSGEVYIKNNNRYLKYNAGDQVQYTLDTDIKVFTSP
jgi:hypothetical protein